MIRIVFDFTAHRYHGTPWGHHVNEGLVEWPPSPWRVVRALLATGYTKLGWQEVPDEMSQLVEVLTANEPTYRLPPATQGHTRHYLPVKGWKNGVPATSLVIDAFVLPEGPLGIVWPADVESVQHHLLKQLIDRIGYLGRAESRVNARVVPEEELPQGMLVSTLRGADDDEPVRLLAPVPRMEYKSWRQEISDAYLSQDLPPEDLLAALQVETSELQRKGWNAPPGSRELVYWRPARALSDATPLRRSPHRVAVARDDAALFALAANSKRDVLPLMNRAFPCMALFRRALLSKVGDEQQEGLCPELTGKDEQGKPLQGEHRHAHFIPLSLDGRNRGRIDHILVYAPMGLGLVAQRAIRRLRKTWAKGMDAIAVTLVGIGDRKSFLRVGGIVVPELASSTKWVSQTPFVPPRFLKPSKNDSLESQVRRELRQRKRPDLAEAPVVALPTDASQAGREARRFRSFARARQGSGKPTPPPGLFHLTLTLDTPIQGPLCLGWGCHFGLGSFVPLQL